MDFTLLNKAFAAIQPETWERVNTCWGWTPLANRP